MVPEVLNRVAIHRDPPQDVGLSREGWTVGTDEVLRSQAQDVLNTFDEYPRVAVLLATDGKNIEKYGPHCVVDAQSQLGKPEGHRVVGVGRCGGDVDLQPRHVDGDGLVTEGVGGRDKSWREWCVGGVSPVGAEAGIHQTVGAIVGEEHSELLNHSTGVRGSNFGGGPHEVSRNAFVTPNGKVHFAGLFHNGLGARYVVKVGVQRSHDGLAGVPA